MIFHGELGVRPAVQQTPHARDAGRSESVRAAVSNCGLWGDLTPMLVWYFAECRRGARSNCNSYIRKPVDFR